MALKVFRRYYPKGRNYLVTPAADKAYTRSSGSISVTVCTPAGLCSRIVRKEMGDSDG